MAALKLGDLLNKQGDVEGARAAYQLAIDSGNTKVASMAALSLGTMLDAQGDTTARAAFRLAIDSGDAEVSPMAALRACRQSDQGPAR